MVTEEIKYRVGTMTKDPATMTEQEYAVWDAQRLKDTREYLFSIGQPLVYFDEDKLVIEYADGSIERRVMEIYIIAGPPGIGKSTSGVKYLPKNIPVIDHDLAAYQYKKQGFDDYQQLSILSGNQKIRDYLFASKSFGLELNLGFQSHYDYLKSIANFDPENKIHLLLFFTDKLSLCLGRASIRHEMGGHLVKPEIVEEMYNATFPLLKQHLSIFKSFSFIDNTDLSVRKVTPKNIPDWLKESGLSYLL